MDPLHVEMIFGPDGDFPAFTPEEENALLQPGDDVWVVVGDMEYLTPATLAILKQRVQEWHKLYPHGVPQAKRKGPYQGYLHTHHLVQAFGCGIRKAQKLLQATRKILGKSKTDFVSIQEFCFINKYDEKVLRKSIGAEDNTDED